VLALAACAPVDGPAERAPDRLPVQVDDALGVVRVAPGEPVVVRIVLDAEGDPEELGRILEAAFRTAVEDFGAVQQGFRVTLGEAIPTECTSASGDRVGRSLAESVELDATVGVLGPQCTGTLLGLQGPAAEAGLVVVTPRPQELTLTEGVDGRIAQDRADGTWRTSPSLLREARAAADHAFEELELSRAATVHDGSLDAAGQAAAFRLRFEALGGTVVVAREVDGALTGDDASAADAALDQVLDAIAAGEVDVVFLPLPTAGVLAIADGLAGRSRLAAVTRITTSAATAGPLLGDPAGVGLLITGPELDFPDAISAVTGMSASQTLERVRAGSGSATAAGWWAYAYDAATLLLKAIEDASLVDVDGTFVLSRSDLRATLARTGFRGLTGTVRCSALGDCAAGPILVRSYEDESFATLADLPVVGRIDG